MASCFERSGENLAFRRQVWRVLRWEEDREAVLRSDLGDQTSHEGVQSLVHEVEKSVLLRRRGLVFSWQISRGALKCLPKQAGSARR